MHYDSVLSRLITSVDALQARVFGSEQFSGPYPPIDRPPVQAASNHDLQRPLSQHSASAPHVPTLNQLRQDCSMSAQANQLVEKFENSALGAYGLSKI
jgi:hypothetical protein